MIGNYDVNNTAEYHQFMADYTNTLFNTSEAILDCNIDSEVFVASGTLDKGTKMKFTFVEFAKKGLGSVYVSDNDDIATVQVILQALSVSVVFLVSDIKTFVVSSCLIQYKHCQ